MPLAYHGPVEKSKHILTHCCFGVHELTLAAVRNSQSEQRGGGVCLEY